MKFLKKIKTTVLLNNFIYLMLGIVMAIVPDAISKFICYIIGGLIAFVGFNGIRRYISNKSNIALILGILAMFFGISIIINPNSFASIIPIIIGLYIIVMAITKYNQAIYYKNTYYKQWYATLIESILLTILGSGGFSAIISHLLYSKKLKKEA